MTNVLKEEKNIGTHIVVEKLIEKVLNIVLLKKMFHKIHFSVSLKKTVIG